MLETTEGEQLIQSFLPISTEVPMTAADSVAQATSFAQYQYLSEWYEAMGIPFHPQCQIFHQFLSGSPCDLCFHSGFEDQSGNFLGDMNNIQTEDHLDGYQMFDGINPKVHNCNDHAINYIPLPDASIPANPSDPEYFFDLNPTNDGDPRSPSGGGNNANFHSFSIFIDEPEQYIPEFVSSTPPSGARSIRINNDWNKYHVNKLTKRFKLKASDHEFTYQNALVLQDPADHDPWEKPFARVILRKGDNILYESCSVANQNDQQFGSVIRPYRYFFGHNEVIVYRDWECHSINLDTLRSQGLISDGDFITAEFIAADCGLGAHFGYMYVSGICEPCNCGGIEINLEPVIQDSCDLFPIEFCGTYTHCDTALESRSFTIVDENGIDVYEGMITDYNETTDSEGNTTGTFCIPITDEDVDAWDIMDGGYDIYVDLVFPSGYKKRSLSATPNVQDDLANDFYVGEDADCCPEFKMSTRINMNNCIGGGQFEYPMMVIQGSFSLPDGYTLCQGMPNKFDAAGIDWTSVSTFGDIVSFMGYVTITDYNLLVSNGGILQGTVTLCGEDRDCDFPITIQLFNGQVTMCADGEIMWDNIPFQWGYPSWQNWNGNWYNILSFPLPFGTVQNGETTCTITQYTIEITYVFGEKRISKGFYTLSSNQAGLSQFSQQISLTNEEYQAGGHFEIKVTSNCGHEHIFTISIGGNGELGDHSEDQVIHSLHIYPNPAADQLYIDLLDKEYELSQVQILDTYGQVKQTLHTKLGFPIQTYVGNLPSGYYQILVEFENGTRVFKGLYIE